MTQTIVTFLLDRTGSMQTCKAATIEAFNAYLDTLKKNAEGIEFSFLQFDSQSLDKICIAENPANVAPLTDASYQPRASTPLIDAAYKTIEAVDIALAERTDKPKIIICIQTDGYENASTEHTMPELSLLIKEKTRADWQFVFMGAGIDAYAQGEKMGVAATHTLSYDHSQRATTQAAFRASATNSFQYAQGKTKSAAFTGAQRHESGDAFHAQRNTGDAAPPKDKKAKGILRAIVDRFSL